MSKCVEFENHWQVYPCNSTSACKGVFDKKNYDCVPSRSCDSQETLKKSLAQLKQSYELEAKNKINNAKYESQPSAIRNFEFKNNFAIVTLANKQEPNSNATIIIDFAKNANKDSSYPKGNNARIGFEELSNGNNPVAQKISDAFLGTCPVEEK